MATDNDYERFRTRLDARREDLRALIASAHEQARPVELDQTRVGRLSRMNALQDQAMARETERRRRLELLRVDTALKRFADGEYGYCLVCEEDIPVKRLEFDPAITVCVDCAGR